MSWFQRFADRLELEKQAIGALIAEGWVKHVDWHSDEAAGIVTADLDFVAGGQLREAKLVYPFIYPFCPLQVMPRLDGERWSAHQWPSGELCLEMRADNWHPEFNGADMLLSARKLLDTEAKVDNAGIRQQVPADHRFTESQYLSLRFLRLVISDDLMAEARRRGVGVHGLDLMTVAHDSCCIFVAVGLAGCVDHGRWIDPGVPDHFSSNPNRVARIAVLNEGDDRHLALIDKHCPPAEIWAQFSSIPFDGNGVVVGLLTDQVLGKWLGDEAFYDIVEVLMDDQQRSPQRNNAVAGKRVAIVGCGSMGSKVASTLARAGVTKFFLVDGDVMKVENLVRNDLDWSAVGAHKVDGVTRRLRAIRAGVEVDGWIGRLNGQHSTSNLVTCLEKLSQCDLIIEASGSGQGFSVAAAVATQDRIPMVWARVFGGGYGGYLARSRPDLEAHPLDVRHEIYTWMTDPIHPKPPKDSDIDYGVEADDEVAMIADDADVSVISAHLARMALDTLRPAAESDYPYSAYLIGLREEWIFKQPFQTFPIVLKTVATAATSEASEEAWQLEAGVGVVAEGDHSPTTQ